MSTDLTRRVGLLRRLPRTHPHGDEIRYFAERRAVRPARCGLCNLPAEPVKKLLREVPLCLRHRWIIVSSMVDEAVRHPEGTCTETCGCLTLEELEEMLDAEGDDQSE